MANFTINNGILYKCNITTDEIIIPEGVTSINEKAFALCKNTTKIKLPSTLKSLGSLSLYGLSAIKELFIPSGVSYISSDALFSCVALQKILVDKNNAFFTSDNDILYNHDKSILYFYPPQKRTDEFEIPDGVVTINEYAFTASPIKKIVMAKSVENIAPYAFFCATSTQILIGSNVNYISSKAFDYCSRLKNLEISPENQYFTVVDGILYSKDKYLLLRCPIMYNRTRITVPAEVRIIGAGAFKNCSMLKNIKIPHSVKSADVLAFSQCKALNLITKILLFIKFGKKVF